MLSGSFDEEQRCYAGLVRSRVFAGVLRSRTSPRFVRRHRAGNKKGPGAGFLTGDKRAGVPPGQSSVWEN